MDRYNNAEHNAEHKDGPKWGILNRKFFVAALLALASVYSLTEVFPGKKVQDNQDTSSFCAIVGEFGYQDGNVEFDTGSWDDSKDVEVVKGNVATVQLVGPDGRPITEKRKLNSVDEIKPSSPATSTELTCSSETD